MKGKQMWKFYKKHKEEVIAGAWTLTILVHKLISDSFSWWIVGVPAIWLLMMKLIEFLFNKYNTRHPL